MIDRALATGMPVNVSPKYWAEHLGLPYHQAAIRELELPVEPARTARGLMALSEGSRSFTRYGYADLLRDDRQYTVRHRVCSGTQRLLASGDPAVASAYSRAFQFCGSTGMDLMEPLTFRGRRGTGVTGHAAQRLRGRASRAALGLGEVRRSGTASWGRLTYNPAHTPTRCSAIRSALCAELWRSSALRARAASCRSSRPPICRQPRATRTGRRSTGTSRSSPSRSPIPTATRRRRRPFSTSARSIRRCFRR